MLKDALAAEVLPIEILHPGGHRVFVAPIEPILSIPPAEPGA
jgi:hypothetical protein